MFRVPAGEPTTAEDIGGLGVNTVGAGSEGILELFISHPTELVERLEPSQCRN